MKNEIEIGFFVKNKEELEAKIFNLGFHITSRQVQTDIMFDTEAAELWLKKDSKIRIRKEGNKATLTYKGAPFITTGVGKRIELEIGIDPNNIDKYIELFTTMGYPILFQLQKERITLVKENVEVIFDNYPILGWRIEIEGAEDEIKELSSILLPGREYKFRYLSQYFTDHMEETGKSIDMLKKEYFEKTGFDIGHIEKIFNY